MTMEMNINAGGRSFEKKSTQDSASKKTGSVTGSLTTQWAKRFVKSALQPMKYGRMTLELPDGEIWSFGTGAAREGWNVSASIQVKSPEFFKRCVLYGDVGFGESYMEGEWESEDVSRVIAWFLLNVEDSPTISGSRRKKAQAALLSAFNRTAHRLRQNSIFNAKRNIQDHYDLSNEFFATFLDPSMTYSCAYYEGDQAESAQPDLERAQMAKIDRLLQKIQLKPGEHLLEIGSGWGALAFRAAEKFGAQVTTITLSEEQFRAVREGIRRRGLEGRVEVLLKDYRLMTGQFDRIVSVEMLEAVGHEYFEAYFGKCAELLKPSGLLGFQVILCPDSRYEQFRKQVDWIQKHIFPGSLLPSIGRINQAIGRTSDLFLHDHQDMGLHYAKTLGLWKERFESNLETVRKLLPHLGGAEKRGSGADERFIRKWRYYLDYCRAAFETRNITVAQMVYGRPNHPELAQATGPRGWSRV